MKKYDLHMHSHFSPDSRMRPENMLQKAKVVGLNGIAITDYHTIAGGLVTKDLNKDKDFEVIVGEEITTYQGDVIALFLKENIEEGRSKSLTT
jgi:predicted metal-dependent phosphoesterase TrpH